MIYYSALEACRDLEIYGVKVLISTAVGAVVGEGVVELHHEVFAKVVIGRYAPIGSETFP